MAEPNQMTGTIAGTLSGIIVCLQVVTATMIAVTPETMPYLRRLLESLRDGTIGNREAYEPGFEIPVNAMIQILDEAEAGISPPSFTLIPGGKDDNE